MTEDQQWIAAALALVAYKSPHAQATAQKLAHITPHQYINHAAIVAVLEAIKEEGKSLDELLTHHKKERQRHYESYRLSQAPTKEENKRD